jgi:hypothetical protein
MRIYERIFFFQCREKGLKQKKKRSPHLLNLLLINISLNWHEHNPAGRCKWRNHFSNPFEGECFTVVLSMHGNRRNIPNLGNSVDFLMQRALTGVLTATSLSELQLLNYGQNICTQSLFKILVVCSDDDLKQSERFILENVSLT